MQVHDLYALLPLLVLAATPVAVMLGIAWKRSHPASLGLTLAGLALALACLGAAAGHAPRVITPLVVVDGLARVYLALLLGASAAVAGLAYGYLSAGEEPAEEFYVLLLLATLGAAVLACSRHFASFFLGLETLSVALYGLIAYPQRRAVSIEAGMKYLILAGAASAFLVFGMALVYAVAGSLEIGGLASVLGTAAVGDAQAVGGLGLGMILVGVGFKLALVPFHLWTPDVYEGAPSPVTAFVATVSKAAVIVVFLRLGDGVDLHGNPALFGTLACLALGSMVAGNVLALLQDNLKRLLAYSSIAHMGYVLVAFLAGGERAVTAVTFYLIAYVITTLGAFGVVTVLSDHGRDADRLSDYHGLAWRSPWLASLLALAVLSLAGLPLTAGFMAKLLLVAAGVGSALWLLVIVLLLTSGMGLYYYLRILVALFASSGRDKPAPASSPVPVVGRLVLASLGLLLLWIGLGPGPWVSWVRTAAAILP